MIETILLIIRLILFAVFAMAAIGKFLDLKGSEKAVKDFGTPDELAKPLSIALPFAEIVFAFCFLFVSTSWLGAIGGLILLVSFTGGMLWQMSQGNAPDCHCFGQIHSEPVSRKSLVRNIIFSLLALILVAAGRGNQGTDIAKGDSDAMQLILIFTVLALIVATLFYLKKVLATQTEILRRIELLELLSREGMPLERHEAGSPHDGLPIGAPFPPFQLNDLSGRPVALSSFLSKGRPAIFFFVSPTCEPCKALLPEMERWEAELGDRVGFVLFTNGTAEANAGKFAIFSKDVVLDMGRKIAESVYARWTPSAVLVRADGTIGSHVAAGDAAIGELIDRVREHDPSDETFFIARSGNGHVPPKIGDSIPQFALPDTNGKTITDAHFRGRRTLTVFWSPTCPHCTAMMDELKTWDAARGIDEPNLIVFSDGSDDDHASLGLRAPVVIDNGYKTSEHLGMFGTPSAVIVNEKGKIITETAMGASNIWALIGRRGGI